MKYVYHYHLEIVPEPAGGAETIDFSKTDVYDELMKRTNKRGPDSCIDAVGCEASGHGAADAVLDKVKAATFLATDRVHVLREAIMCCRKAGTVSIPGVYVGMGDKIPLGAAMNKGLTIKTGQTHVQAYTKPLLEKIVGEALARLLDVNRMVEGQLGAQGGKAAMFGGDVSALVPPFVLELLLARLAEKRAEAEGGDEG